jgi:uncharacterized protein YkwD
MEMRVTIRIRLASVVLVGLFAIFVARAQTGGTVAEQELFASVNRARRAQGLPVLKWNDALATAAHRHAALMAEHAAAEHGFPGEPSLASRVTQAGARFVWVSENVARGATVELIHAEFSKSPNHRANMLDSDMDSIGVGIVERSGELFAVEDFCKAK